MWKVIKGAIRNTTLLYALKIKKENREHELKLIKDKNNILRDIPASHKMEDDMKTLKDKKSELQGLQEKRLLGFIVWA